jgi:hypothetical protein
MSNRTDACPRDYVEEIFGPNGHLSKVSIEQTNSVITGSYGSFLHGQEWLVHDLDLLVPPDLIRDLYRHYPNKTEPAAGYANVLRYNYTPDNTTAVQIDLIPYQGAFEKTDVVSNSVVGPYGWSVASLGFLIRSKRAQQKATPLYRLPTLLSTVRGLSRLGQQSKQQRISAPPRDTTHRMSN